MEGHYDYIGHLFDDIEDIDDITYEEKYDDEIEDIDDITYEEKYDDEIDISALDYNEDEIEDIIKSIKM